MKNIDPISPFPEFPAPQNPEMNDQLTCFHVSLLAACFYYSSLQGNIQIRSSRRALMNVSRIRSFATYHRCIKDLVALGYIAYKPTYDPRKGSMITLLCITKRST